MAQTAAHLVDHVIPHVPVRQWVLALPIPLRLLLTAQPKLVTPVTKAFDVVHLADHSATDWMPKAGNPDGAKQSPLSGVVIGAAAVLSAQDLLLQDTPPYLVTLGSDILGGWGPTLRQGGVQVVVSCQRGMHDEPAHHFFDAFYAALCAGRAVGHALQEARHAALRCNNDGLIAAVNMLCHGNPDYGWTITPPTEPPPAAARRSARKSVSKSASESASTTARKNASR